MGGRDKLFAYLPELRKSKDISYTPLLAVRNELILKLIISLLYRPPSPRDLCLLVLFSMDDGGPDL